MMEEPEDIKPDILDIKPDLFVIDSDDLQRRQEHARKLLACRDLIDRKQNPPVTPQKQNPAAQRAKRRPAKKGTRKKEHTIQNTRRKKLEKALMCEKYRERKREIQRQKERKILEKAAKKRKKTLSFRERMQRAQSYETETLEEGVRAQRAAKLLEQTPEEIEIANAKKAEQARERRAAKTLSEFTPADLAEIIDKNRKRAEQERKRRAKICETETLEERDARVEKETERRKANSTGLPAMLLTDFPSSFLPQKVLTPEAKQVQLLQLRTKFRITNKNSKETPQEKVISRLVEKRRGQIKKALQTPQERELRLALMKAPENETHAQKKARLLQLKLLEDLRLEENQITSSLAQEAVAIEFSKLVEEACQTTDLQSQVQETSEGNTTQAERELSESDASGDENENSDHHDDDVDEQKQMPGETLEEWTERLFKFTEKEFNREVANISGLRPCGASRKAAILAKNRLRRIKETQADRLARQKQDAERLKKSKYPRTFRSPKKPQKAPKTKKQKHRQNNETPEQTAKRAKLEAEKEKIRDQIVKAKAQRIAELKEELERQKVVLAMETAEERELRIEKETHKLQSLGGHKRDNYMDLRAKLTNAKTPQEREAILQEKERRVREKQNKNWKAKIAEETPEESAARKAQNAENAKIRIPMQRAELSVFKTLTSAQAPEDLETFLKEESTINTIKFWFNYRMGRRNDSLKEWRATLNRFLVDKKIVGDSESAESREKRLNNNFECLRNLKVKSGEVLVEYFEKKVNYLHNYQKARGYLKGTNPNLTQEEKEARRVRQNAMFRVNYNRKKFGIELKLGEYGGRPRVNNKNKLKNPQQQVLAEKVIETETIGAKSTSRRGRPKKSHNLPVTSISATPADNCERRAEEASTVGVNVRAYNTRGSSSKPPLVIRGESYSNEGDFLGYGEESASEAGDMTDDAWEPVGTFEVDPVLPNEFVSNRTDYPNVNLGLSEFPMGSNVLSNQMAQPTLQYSNLSTGICGYPQFQQPFQSQQSLPWNSNIPTLPFWNSDRILLENPTISSGQLPLNYSTQPFSEQEFLPNAQNQIQLNMIPQVHETAIQPANAIIQNLQQNSRENCNNYSNSQMQVPSLVLVSSEDPKRIQDNSQSQEPNTSVVNAQENDTATSSTNVSVNIPRNVPQNNSEKVPENESNVPENVPETSKVPNEEQSKVVGFMSVKCAHCADSFASQLMCDVHVKRMHGSIRYDCKVCGRAFVSPKGLVCHLWFVHFNPSAVKCPFCPPNITERKKLRMLRHHIHTCHPSEINTYLMGVDEMNLEKATKFRCFSCPSDFDTSLKLNEHFGITHSRMKFVCGVCGLLLSAKEHLEDHLQFFHPQENKKNEGLMNVKEIEIDCSKSFECILCCCSFYNAEFLGKHNEICSLEESVKVKEGNSLNEFRCETCSKIYYKKKWLKKHGRNCKARIDFMCFWCEETFLTEDLRREHIYRKHSQEKKIPRGFMYSLFKCELCQGSFKNLISLRMHFYYTHGHMHQQLKEKINKVYGNQPIDESVFVALKQNPSETLSTNNLETLTESELAVSHEEEVLTNSDTQKDQISYTCPVCDKSLTTKEFHFQHTLFSTRIAKYCELCERTFSSNSQLRRHYERFECDKRLAEKALETAGSSQKYSCEKEFCSLEFTAQEFHKHHSLFSMEPEFACKSCERKFFSRIARIMHGRRDHNLQDYRTTDKKSACANDKEKGAEAKDKDKKQDACADAIVVIFCNNCRKIFKTEEFKQRHVDKEHGGVESNHKRPVCIECKSVFAGEQEYNRHKMSIHNKERKRHPCQYCGMTLSRLEHLRSHIRKIHGDNPTVVQPSEFKKQEEESKKGKERKYKCPHCEMSYDEHNRLKDHLKRYHGENDKSADENIRILLTYRGTTRTPIVTEFSFCDYCGLQMVVKNMKAHFKSEHPHELSMLADGNTLVWNSSPYNHDPSVPKLSFSQIFEMIKEIEGAHGPVKKHFSRGDHKAKNPENFQNAKKRQRKENSDEDSSGESNASESSSEEDWFSDGEEIESEISDEDGENLMNKKRVSLKEVIIKPDLKANVKKGRKFINPHKPKSNLTKKKSENSDSEMEEPNSDEEFIPSTRLPPEIPTRKSTRISGKNIKTKTKRKSKDLNSDEDDSNEIVASSEANGSSNFPIELPDDDDLDLKFDLEELLSNDEGDLRFFGELSPDENNQDLPSDLAKENKKTKRQRNPRKRKLDLDDDDFVAENSNSDLEASEFENSAKKRKRSCKKPTRVLPKRNTNKKSKVVSENEENSSNSDEKEKRGARSKPSRNSKRLRKTCEEMLEILASEKQPQLLLHRCDFMMKTLNQVKSAKSSESVKVNQSQVGTSKNAKLLSQVESLKNALNSPEKVNKYKVPSGENPKAKKSVNSTINLESSSKFSSCNFDKSNAIKTYESLYKKGAGNSNGKSVGVLVIPSRNKSASKNNTTSERAGNFDKNVVESNLTDYPVLNLNVEFCDEVKDDVPDFDPFQGF